MDRRQTTILAADMVGYSRLMAADEEGVIARLRKLRKDLIDPAIAEAGGRIVKTMGDGLLVEFPSPLSAVRMAVTVQNAMQGGETGPEDQRIRFRIGVNSGDIIIDGDDILGDAVNIAARLESLAPPGGICIGRTAHYQIKNRIDAPMTALGPQMVKNIPDPVEVWRVEIAGVKAPATKRKAERPSIAVLPFDNMSADPDQDFLADGIVEDVITELSRFRWLLVIARNSTFAYKGTHKDVREIARELDVRYVVEGSVRRAGDRLRIAAQLIEAETGVHIWAERFDRVMADLFDMQDEVTRAIVTAVEPELGAHERALARRKPTDSLGAWELYQRGLAGYLAMDEADFDEARRCFDAATRADPDFALAHAALARTYSAEVVFGNAPDRAAAIELGFASARRAMKLDPRDDDVHRSLGFLEVLEGRSKDAIETLNRGIDLNANNAPLRFNRAMALYLEYRYDEGLADLDAAIRLSPNDPLIWLFRLLRGIGLLGRRDGDDDAEALAEFESSAKAPSAGWPAFFLLAAGNMLRGRTGAAKAALDQAFAQKSNLTFELAMRSLPLPTLPDRVLDAARDLVALGLPRE